MKCPACETQMVTVVIRSVEIDRCPSCGGVALDKGEAETIDALGLAHVIEGGVVATLQHRSTPARCHECGKDMIALKGAGDVEYDWCDACERLFFDRGELTALGAFSDS
jgi:Zn-finger nucleic acid-binding protein